MSDLILGSGGFVVMHEEFRDRIFKDSFPKVDDMICRSILVKLKARSAKSGSVQAKALSMCIAQKKSPLMVP